MPTTTVAETQIEDAHLAAGNVEDPAVALGCDSDKGLPLDTQIFVDREFGVQRDRAGEPEADGIPGIGGCNLAAQSARPTVRQVGDHQ